MTEATIIIGNTMLTEAQAMTVRVAITDFLAEMNDPNALGDDFHGRAMTKAYRERLCEIIPMMVSK